MLRVTSQFVGAAIEGNWQGVTTIVVRRGNIATGLGGPYDLGCQGAPACNAFPESSEIIVFPALIRIRTYGGDNPSALARSIYHETLHQSSAFGLRSRSSHFHLDELAKAWLGPVDKVDS